MSISGRKSQMKRNKANGETHTMNSTDTPINILVSDNSWGEIDDNDDEEPLAEELPALHAAAWRIFIAVVIVAAVTTNTITTAMPAPYTKLSRYLMIC